MADWKSGIAIEIVEEKISELEYRPHEISYNTGKKDEKNDYVKEMLRHMNDRIKKLKIYYMREQNLKDFQTIV